MYGSLAGRVPLCLSYVSDSPEAARPDDFVAMSANPYTALVGNTIGLQVSLVMPQHCATELIVLIDFFFRWIVSKCLD